MRLVKALIFTVVFCLANAPALAQQTAATQNGEIKIQGLDQLNASAQRIEQYLRQFANIRWEYQFVQRNRLQNSEDTLAQLGAEGWELVTVTVEEGYIFKRAILQ